MSTIIPELQINEIDSFQKSITIFRDLVNKPRRHHALSQHEKNFSSICSALDNLDDTLLALYSYTKSPHHDKGRAYLEIFGVLQSLCVQQDAVTKLYEIIMGTSINLQARYDDIKDIRDIRIRAVGHPVGGKGSNHFFTRYTVSKFGFELLGYDQVGDRTSTKVDLPSLIKKNSIALHDCMSDLVNHMKIEDEKHKEKFMEDSLEKLFKNSVYFSSKLFEGVSGRSSNGMEGLTGIKYVIEEFCTSLKNLSAHFDKSGFILHDIPRLKYALGKFEEYVQGNESKSEDDAYILARFIQVELKMLEDIAKEIAEKYENLSLS